MNVIADRADEMSASTKAQRLTFLTSQRKDERERSRALAEIHERFNQFADSSLEQLTVSLKALSDQNRAAKEWWSQRKVA